MNQIMIAKSKFMAVVHRMRASKIKKNYRITKKRMKSIEEWQKDKIESKNQRKKDHENICRNIVEKCHVLKGMHEIFKRQVNEKINIIELSKGESYNFKNYPLIDFFVVAEGRIEVNWYQ